MEYPGALGSPRPRSRAAEMPSDFYFPDDPLTAAEVESLEDFGFRLKPAGTGWPQNWFRHLHPTHGHHVAMHIAVALQSSRFERSTEPSSTITNTSRSE